MKLISILKLDFIPGGADLALLLLRLWLGLSMLILHGWGKLLNFSKVSEKFPALVGTPELSLGLAVFAEVACAALLVVGLFTRLAALNLVITMAVAFFVVHGGALSGEHSGELGFIYLAGYVALLLAGGGRYSLDNRLGAKRN